MPLPVINIGSRQEGRERASNVLDVPPRRAAIERGIRTALSADFRESLREVLNPYGDGHAATRIVDLLTRLPDRRQLLRKQFHGLPEPMAISGEGL